MGSLHLWQNGELVGEWEHVSNGADRFRYAASWLASPASRRLSASFPWPATADDWIKGPLVGDWFENLLPDSAQIREQIARRFGVGQTPFELLKEIGRDCVGAVQLLAPGQTPDNVRTIQCRALTEEQIADELRRTAHPAQYLADEGTPFRISLAGAQEKTAFLFHEGKWCRPIGSTPTTHIFKLPLQQVGDVPMPHSLENEWLCAQLLNALGIPTAKSEVLDFGDWSCLAVERFDRKLAPNGEWWMRLPQEDFCQAMAVPPRQKYESDGGPGITSCVQLLRAGSSQPQDAWTFFRTQVLLWVLQAPDGHGKNFSIQHLAGGDFRLTPLYDVHSAYPISGHGRNKLPVRQLKMAMAVSSKNRHYRWQEVGARHWLAHASAVGLGQQMEAQLASISKEVEGAVSKTGQKLPKGFPGKLFDSICNGAMDAANNLCS
ncbi:MAG: type II toxin-antitoxin system HipA family toxin [Planctomycetes bacterium]|nr:type II toxin-antitoxin system HipA family toxin [Planctomycetota bacterium]